MKPATNQHLSISAVNPSPESERASAASRRRALITEAVPTADGARLLWEPMQRDAGSTPTSTEILHATAPRGAVSADLEAELIEIAMRPLRPDESQQTGNDNRERELRACFATLSPIEAYAIRRRLEIDRDSDKLAAAFRRLLTERRERLKSFLADPRRGRAPTR